MVYIFIYILLCCLFFLGKATTSLFTFQGGLVIKDLPKMASTARGKSL